MQFTLSVSPFVTLLPHVWITADIVFRFVCACVCVFVCVCACARVCERICVCKYECMCVHECVWLVVGFVSGEFGERCKC